MRHPENSKYVELCRLQTLDAASACGMTITERLA